jgi:hypothetical protein
MRGQVLLQGSSCPELITRSYLPEANWRIKGYPSVDIVVLIFARVLVLVIDLDRGISNVETQNEIRYLQMLFRSYHLYQAISLPLLSDQD